MTPQHPLDLITRGVPSLQAWWDEYRAEDNYDPTLPRLHLSEFTLHILDQAQGGVIPSFDTECCALARTNYRSTTDALAGESPAA